MYGFPTSIKQKLIHLCLYIGEIPIESGQVSTAIEREHCYWNFTIPIHRENSQNKKSERHVLPFGIRPLQPCQCVKQVLCIDWHEWSHSISTINYRILWCSLSLFLVILLQFIIFWQYTLVQCIIFWQCTVVDLTPPNIEYMSCCVDSKCCECAQFSKMQLDVDRSPPANIMTLRLTLTHMTFDLDLMNYCPGVFV